MRQRSVQQQNRVSEDAIRSKASFWRKQPLPRALVECALSRGVDCSAAIFLQLEIDFPGMPRLWGMLLTEAERFIQFEIETDERHVLVESVEIWADVTSGQNLDAHNPGFGAGFGALAVGVLRQLNAEA